MGLVIFCISISWSGAGEKDVFSCFLKMAYDSFHQLVTVQEKVREMGYLFGMAPQGIVHLQNASFWRVHKFALASLGILVQRQLLSCRHTSVP